MDTRAVVGLGDVEVEIESACERKMAGGRGQVRGMREREEVSAHSMCHSTNRQDPSLGLR